MASSTPPAFVELVDFLPTNERLPAAGFPDAGKSETESYQYGAAPGAENSSLEPVILLTI